ncbi:MAG: hypothetical protein R2823_07710 [Acidimicrobiia bacterium]
MTTINKADLEAKLREIEGVVTDFEEEARSNAATVAVVAGIAVVVIVAVIAWRSRRSKIRVEVYQQ